MGNRFCCPPEGNSKSSLQDEPIENTLESKDPVVNFERSFPFTRTKITDFYDIMKGIDKEFINMKDLE